MYTRVLFIVFLVVFAANTAFSQLNKSYFFPADTAVNENIPEPGSLCGHKYGWWHFSHDQLANYMVNLAGESDRVTIREYGRTHENRPLYLLAITSPENHQRLDEIRQAHLDYLHGRSTDYVDQDMPVIIWLGYSVHGNESSAGNASLLTAYYLASSRSDEVEHTLDNAVILVDPVLNPDGFSRAANWSNMHTHRVQTGDRRDRQFREDWPGGRTNHYWFDLNRDWMPAQHPESKARLKAYHHWKPHVVTDHHEMGSNSTFFFQPGEPERVNPRTPEENYGLTQQLGRFHARALDDIGSLYFSKEGFDDFYYGKGSTYPDGNASIGILFEQSRMMGQMLEGDHGKSTFARAIRNHFTVSLSTIRGALSLKEKLNDYQRSFYAKIPRKVGDDEVKGYVFGAEHNPAKLHHFLELMHHHQIKVNRLKEDVQIQDESFSPRSSYLVSADQPQYRFIKSLFEKRTHFEDSIFYDISTWTMPLAFNLDYAAIESSGKVSRLKGERVKFSEPAPGKIIGGESEVGYLLHGSHYNLYRIIHKIQQKDLVVKAASNSFTIPVSSGKVSFKPGAIFVHSRRQELSPDQIYTCLQEIAKKEGVNFYGVETALTPKGSDLGSWSMDPLEERRILMVAGEGTSSYSAGEIWHLLDHRFRIPVVMIKPNQLERTNLFDFNTLILPDGWYDWDEEVKQQLDTWLRQGGVLVGLEGANDWLAKHKLIHLEKKARPEMDSTHVLPYNERGNKRRAQSISGVILKGSIDPTHPINYGIRGKTMPLFKDNNEIYKKSGSPYDTPVLIGEDPLMSGYLSDENRQRIKNTPYCHLTQRGGGTIISFTADPNFRAFWYGTNKLFMNAVFFGGMVR